MQRLSFPHIATERHPLATGRHVALSVSSQMLEPEKKDIEIAREILRIHSKLKRGTATGEWKWINRNKRSNYIVLLENGNPIALSKCLANMFRNDSAYGIISSDFSRTKTKKGQFDLENHILLDLDTFQEFDGSDRRSVEWGTQARKWGNPYGYITRNKKLISIDTARHVYYANKVLALLKDAAIKKPAVVEVGGGYGGLCREVFRRARPSGLTYINCDLPETLYLCYYFLRKSLPSVSIKWALDKIPVADIVLVPAHNQGLIARARAAIFFNALSFSEMNRQTIKEYMALLHRMKPKYFLHVNSNFVLFPNSERHVEIPASEFGINTSLYKQVYMALSPWQGSNGRSRECLYIRRETKI